MADTSTGSRLRAEVAEEVRALLGRRRMSDIALARKIERSHTYLYRRLTGETAFDVDDLERIADVLGVTIADLLPASARRFTRDYLATVPAPRVASTPVPALADRFVTAALTGVQPSGLRRTAPTGR